jgi:tetratricopeptide (TPR) repeat protein
VNTARAKINPGYAEAYVARGNAYFNKGQYDLAIADATKALEISPGNAQAHYNRGVAYANQRLYVR